MLIFNESDNSSIKSSVKHDTDLPNEIHAFLACQTELGYDLTSPLPLTCLIAFHPYSKSNKSRFTETNAKEQRRHEVAQELLESRRYDAPLKTELKDPTMMWAFKCRCEPIREMNGILAHFSRLASQLMRLMEMTQYSQ